MYSRLHFVIKIMNVYNNEIIGSQSGVFEYLQVYWKTCPRIVELNLTNDWNPYIHSYERLNPGCSPFQTSHTAARILVPQISCCPHALTDAKSLGYYKYFGVTAISFCLNDRLPHYAHSVSIKTSI
jgi:hypothetical protein